MKTGGFLFIIIAFASGISACERIDRDYDSLPRRSEVYDSGRPEGSLIEPGFSPGDTALLICGISAPDGYDWRTDSAIGISSQCRLVLYRNLEEVLSLQTGYNERISTDPDTHHLIDGHLYTEFSTTDSTIIKRDGVFRAGFKGREYLLGLLENDGTLYTLSRDRDGAFITYRTNGVQLLKIKGATVFGSLEDSSYPRNGALYYYKGSVYFSYYSFFGGKRANHVVRDGIDSQLDAGAFPEKIDDIKMHMGEIWAVGQRNDQENSYALFTAEGCRQAFTFNEIIRNRKLYTEINNYPLVYAQRYYESGAPMDCMLYYFAKALGFWTFGDYHVFWNGEKAYAVPIEEDNHYLFSRGCVDVFNGSVYRAITPVSKNRKPYILKDEDKREINLDGYLTGVGVFVSPPS